MNKTIHCEKGSGTARRAGGCRGKHADVEGAAADQTLIFIDYLCKSDTVAGDFMLGENHGEYLSIHLCMEEEVRAFPSTEVEIQTYHTPRKERGEEHFPGPQALPIRCEGYSTH